MDIKHLPHLACLYFLLLISCNTNKDTGSQDSQTLFTSLPASQTGIDFQNSVYNTEDLNIFTYRNFYNGGGVAIGDINNDGLNDVYLTANMGSNKLYLNKGDFNFEDITQSAGVGLPNKWSTGVVMVDLNHDGLLDLYVCNAGFLKGQDQKNVLFINKGDLTFSDEASEYGLDENGYTTHAAFLDYDKDGDLDVYMLNNSFIPTNTLNYSNKRDLPASEWPVKDFLKGGGDKFFRNDKGTFTDVSKEVGIYQSLIGFGLGVTIGDINSDGYDDLYISNDFFEKDYLYINQKDGTFSEEAENYFEHLSHSSMGADLRDINNDAQPDLFVTDMLPGDDYRLKTNASFDDINLRRLKVEQGFYHQYMHNTLQVNAGKKFKEIAFHAGVAGSDWSWGALMFDADNDRYNDILVCNGIFHDVIDLDFMDFFANDLMQKMVLTGKKEDMESVINKMPSNPIPNKFFQNQNGHIFQDVAASWGLGQETFSNGAAYGDLNNDGRLDLVINNVNQPALVYQNHTEYPSVTIKLVGEAPNTMAIGAKLFLESDEGTQFHQINPSRGFQSSVPYEIVLGMAKLEGEMSVKVQWPSGKTSQSSMTAGGSRKLTLYEKDAVSADAQAAATETQSLFGSVNHPFPSHAEDDFVDYYYERGIYRMLSREGPAVAVGDVNGDGKEDVYFGGAKGQSGGLFLSAGNRFRPKTIPAFEDDKEMEDVVAVFFDADQDKDLDLYVGSGGNHLQPNAPDLKDRLYFNDGKGGFVRAASFDPGIGMNTSKVVPVDYDKDGDLDLLVTSRSVPQHYGYSPVHFFFQNEGKGEFREKSKQLFDYFKGVGMVTDACFVDLLGDENLELVLVGDWDAPRVFQFLDGAYEETETDLSGIKGWYYAIAHADLDNDGKQDLILGNHGTNSYLQVDDSTELALWMNDFDGNGYVDKVLTYWKNGKEVPVMLKKDLADQINSIKKAGIKHHDYATKGFRELLPETAFEKAKSKKVNYLKSVIAFNRGEGRFELGELPAEAQFSSIKAILPIDIDEDGDIDLVTGGNDYHLLPQFSRMDAKFWVFTVE